MLGIFEKFDEFTWRFVPAPLKSLIERRSWLTLLGIYTILAALVIYRFVYLRRSIFFHSASPLGHPHVESSTQVTELIIHLFFFFVPMMLAFTFNRNQAE
jgi:hypothetical protein